MHLQSRAWRLNNLYAIKPAIGPIEAFKCNDAQKHYYNHQHFNNHILKARKLGFSTYNMIDALDAMIHCEGTEVGIIDYSLPDAKKKLAMIKLAYENMTNSHIHSPDVVAYGRLIHQKCPMRFSKTEITFANGSSAYCGTSLRGSTPNRLYISELGKTSIFAPIKAEEIRTGALNALTPGNLITIESTHEGGKFGMHYELLQKAMENTSPTAVDFAFHFFPWWLDDRYTLPDNRPLTPEALDYFAKIDPQLEPFCEKHHFPYRPLTHSQKLWYDAKSRIQGHGMKKEFPTLPGEAFEAPNDNAIYGTHMADARAAKRIIDIEINPSRPLFTFWDIGVSDYTAIWLAQFDGPWLMVCNWFEDCGHPVGHYANVIRQWENHYKAPIARHYLPHDANTRDRGSALSYVAMLNQAGINNITVVPRTPDIWHGINEIRNLLPRTYFHATNCDTPRPNPGGTPFPSGVACLEGYQRRLSRDGLTIQEIPWHNTFSHSADALRTLGEAHRLGMIDVTATITHHRPNQDQPRRIITTPLRKR